MRIATTAATFGGPDDIVLSLGSGQVLATLDGRYLSTEVAGGFTGRMLGLQALTAPTPILQVAYITL